MTFKELILEESFIHYITFVSVFILFLVSLSCMIKRPKLKLPPGPWGLPIVGYLPFLGKEPFRTLDSLSKKYGNIYSLYFGRTFVVMLGDYPTIKEAFSKWETTDKPPELFSFIPNGAGFSSANGKEWVEQRRFSVKVMKSLAFAESRWTQQIEEEIGDLLQLIHSHGRRPINIFKLLTSSVSNTISLLLFSKRLPFDDPNFKFLDEGLDDVVKVFSQTGVYVHFPGLIKFMSRLNIGRYASCHALAAGFSKFIRNEVELHRRRQNTTSKDFIDSYLKEMKVQQKFDAGTTFNERNLLGNTQGLFIGGSDTVVTSLSWLMLAMVTYPDVQRKVHEELDSVLGEGQRASWEERFNFPYTYAVLMENNRWKTTVPLNTSHVVRETIKLGEFDIPKGSTIIANNWAIHNNPTYWKDPENFSPERFLLDEGRKVNFRPENYVTFSYGKRNCPGEMIAMMEMFLYFTSLMQFFEVQTPNGEKPRLDGVLGLMYSPVPQELIFLPRSSGEKLK